jgi:DNA-binding protein HU-beta
MAAEPLTINRTVLCDEIAQMTGLPKGDVNTVVGALIYGTQLHVKRGDRVGLTGFGTWEQVTRSARTARNPRSGEPVKVKASKAPRFRPGQTFKAVVRGEKLERPAGLKALGAASRGVAGGSSMRPTAAASRSRGRASTPRATTTRARTATATPRGRVAGSRKRASK